MVSRKKWHGLPLPWEFAVSVLLILLVFFMLQGARCAQTSRAAQEELAAYPVQKMEGHGEEIDLALEDFMS